MGVKTVEIYAKSQQTRIAKSALNLCERRDGRSFWGETREKKKPMRLKISLMVPAVAALGLTTVYAGRVWVERQVAQRLEAQRDHTPAAGPALHRIVVAAEPLGFGQEITRASLREIPWPAENVIEGSFTSIDELVDGKTKRMALAALQSNEPVLARKITGPNQRANLAAVIQAGHKAITLRVDDIVGVAGFLQPGDRVDVLLARKSNKVDPVSDVVLQNLKVLGIDQTVDERGAKPTVARSVTLEVTPEDAQRLVVAQSVGALTLVLRPIGEADLLVNRTVSTADLLQTPRGATESAGPSQATVGVIRNLARQTYSVPARGAP